MTYKNQVWEFFEVFKGFKTHFVALLLGGKSYSVPNGKLARETPFAHVRVCSTANRRAKRRSEIRALHFERHGRDYLK